MELFANCWESRIMKCEKRKGRKFEKVSARALKENYYHYENDYEWR